MVGNPRRIQRPWMRIRVCHKRVEPYVLDAVNRL
ncbi:hypothetical protein T01_11282 [Trichinella spiralis]|uniref:Uncharacterized protein n=1 Tax=Trichinella spiralis TaxID=6334 RepID=A0A0V0YZ58_TRISP|nr:hypothetical protein T01_11282 [Trichinella spiralis]